MKTTTQISSKSDATTSTKIQKIRLAAGGDPDCCPTCCRPVSDPSRQHDKVTGETIYGCVDAAHSGRIPSWMADWHDRQAARQIRRRELDAIERRHAH